MRTINGRFLDKTVGFLCSAGAKPRVRFHLQIPESGFRARRRDAEGDDVPLRSDIDGGLHGRFERSEEHTSELQSLMRISYAVFCLKQQTITIPITTSDYTHTSHTPDTAHTNDSTL